MTKKSLLFLMLAAVLVLAACGGGGDAPAADGASAASAAGEELFAETILGSQPGCSTCHSLEEGTTIVGPSMAGIGSRAGTTVSGQSAEDYLRESILDPDAHVVDGFQPGVMIQVWADELTDEQVDQLVAYLLTLK